MGRMPEPKPCSLVPAGAAFGGPYGLVPGLSSFPPPQVLPALSGSALPPPWATLCPGLGHLVLWGSTPQTSPWSGAPQANRAKLWG